MDGRRQSEIGRRADVVICDTEDAEATMTVEKLFQPTTGRIVHLPLEQHDRIMADLLSLAHAAAIAVALALPPTEHPVSSTTLKALKSLAGSVVRESSEVFFRSKPTSLSSRLMRSLHAANVEGKIHGL